MAASSPTDDQRVFLRAGKLLHYVLPCQRLPQRPERFLIHQPHRTPARGVLRTTAAVVRPFARTRVSRIAGVQRTVRATDDVDEVHASIVADLVAISGAARGGPELASSSWVRLKAGEAGLVTDYNLLIRTFRNFTVPAPY